jgi:hypothetical protein
MTGRGNTVGIRIILVVKVKIIVAVCSLFYVVSGTLRTHIITICYNYQKFSGYRCGRQEFG